MPYNPKKNGAANYKSWMQLTQAQIDALAAIEGEDNTEVPNDEQFAQVVYVINSSESGGAAAGTISDGVNNSILATVKDLTNANALATLLVDADGNQITSFGSSAIAEETIPTPVLTGEEVNPWYDLYGRQVLFGANLSLNAMDVNLINDSQINRLGPVTNLEVSASTSGDAIDVSYFHNYTVHIISSGVTTGATVTIEHSLDGTNWVIISTEVIASDEVTEYTYTNQAYKYLRTRVSDYSDGTYTTLVFAGN